MDRKFLLGIAVAVTIVFFAAACGSYVLKNTVQEQDRETVHQVSTIDALMQGAFEGVEPIGEFRTHGDFGIGTFEGAEGELIFLEGVVYQAKSDGSVIRAADSMTTPFGVATWFDPELTDSTDNRMNYSELSSALTKKLPSKNLIYAVKIHDTFPAMKVRAIPKSELPYPTLTEASQRQSVFSYTNITGTVIGFYVPALFDGINVPGYHLHFIADDKKTGGHILDFTAEEGTMVTYDVTPHFEMTLPESGVFMNADLSQNLSADLAKVEK